MHTSSTVSPKMVWRCVSCTLSSICSCINVGIGSVIVVCSYLPVFLSLFLVSVHMSTFFVYPSTACLSVCLCHIHIFLVAQYIGKLIDPKDPRLLNLFAGLHFCLCLSVRLSIRTFSNMEGTKTMTFTMKHTCIYSMTKHTTVSVKEATPRSPENCI